MGRSSKLQRAAQLLSGHVLENITMLKMLEAYRDSIECRLLERGEEWALILCLPVSCSSYDRRSYPEAEAIIMIAGSEQGLMDELLGGLPLGKPLILKCQKKENRECIEARFKVTFMRSFYTYSRLVPVPNMEISGDIEESGYNERLVPLWMNNGYDRQELLAMFQRGARSYTLYTAGEPVSTCLTYYNYDNVWEIGAVFTRDDQRGKGYARRVAAAAVNRLLERKLIPRYQVLDSNSASIKVAEALGLSRVVTLEHLYYDGNT